ncbi:DUF1800 family protein [Xanthomonadaceae bacterium XH05]|nr:DUF1800 family protein [Xanthomonadaceae bacterium XH05]
MPAFPPRLRHSLVAACVLLTPLATHAQAIFDSSFEFRIEVPDSDAEAARFLTQASFGPTPAEIAHLRAMEGGYAAWIDEQLATPASYIVPYLDYIDSVGEPVYNNARLEGWWQNALLAPDQLRQRVAFALSQIFVVSEASDAIHHPYATGHFYDTLIRQAFGNYRELLEAVTLAPAMGDYLSMRQNHPPDAGGTIRPDENYAREVLQLFSIGLVLLHPDGTPVLENGTPVPAYTQFNVKTFAHIFTGWNYGNDPLVNNCTHFEWCYVGYPFPVAWSLPMQAFPDFHHTEPDADPDNDVLLGNVPRPLDGTPESNLAFALDNIAGHPNVGPFISRRLIQHLVTSNPSPAYIARMTSVFNDNGSGVRGDMGALVRAILLDPEARSGHRTWPATFGKVREPLLRQSHLWRAFQAVSLNNRYSDWNPEFDLGQAPNRSRSVFNFFQPDYQLPGEVTAAGLYSPELQIVNETLVTTTANRFWIQSERWHIGSPWASGASQWTILLDFEPYYSLAGNPSALLDALDVLLMNGQMSGPMRSVLLSHLNGIDPVAPHGPRNRVWGAVHLIMTSPEYMVQK